MKASAFHLLESLLRFAYIFLFFAIAQAVDREKGKGKKGKKGKKSGKKSGKKKKKKKSGKKSGKKGKKGKKEKDLTPDR